MSDTPPAAEPGLDQVLGFELIELGPELATARFEVQAQHKQPYGLVHGGVYAALAETVTSVATAAAVLPEGKIAVGLSNNTSFMRPATHGHVHAVARRRHAGRTTWLWDVDMTDDEGRLCAICRMTIAVRPAPAGQ